MLQFILMLFPTFNVISADLLSILGYRVKISMLLVFWHRQRLERSSQYRIF